MRRRGKIFEIPDNMPVLKRKKNKNKNCISLKNRYIKYIRPEPKQKPF
jgi:hypothetical protein